MWAALVVPDGASTAESVALGMTTLAAVIALSAPVGDRMVNGSSYGDERRMPLRPPGVLLLGPIELTWLVVVVGVVAGPMLLGARQWVRRRASPSSSAGSLAALGVRILHRLSQRWFVFVPAGVVVVDQMALTDSLLVQRQRVDSIGPAPADTQAVDLTVGAIGLALELRLTEPDLIIPAPPRRFGGGQATIDPVEVRVGARRPHPAGLGARARPRAAASSSAERPALPVRTARRVCERADEQRAEGDRLRGDRCGDGRARLRGAGVVVGDRQERRAGSTTPRTTG